MVARMSTRCFRGPGCCGGSCCAIRSRRMFPPRLLATFYPPIPRQSGRHILLWAGRDFWVKISIGLWRHRHFGSNLQQACGDIDLSVSNSNRPAAISPSGFKIATGLRRYRLVGSKLHRAVLNIGCGTETALDLVYNISARNLMK